MFVQVDIVLLGIVPFLMHECIINLDWQHSRPNFALIGGPVWISKSNAQVQ